MGSEVTLQVAPLNTHYAGYVFKVYRVVFAPYRIECCLTMYGTVYRIVFAPYRVVYGNRVSLICEQGNSGLGLVSRLGVRLRVSGIVPVVVAASKKKFSCVLLQ